MQRKQEISILNVILTLMVVLIHLMSEPLSMAEKGSVVSMAFFVAQKLTSFVVPGFLFASAIKLFIKTPSHREFAYVPFLKGRFSKLYIHYFVAVNVFFIYFVSRGFVAADVETYTKALFLGKLVSHLYFMVILFQFYLLMPLLLRYTEKLSAAWGLLIALAVTIYFKQFFPMVQWTGLQWLVQYSDRIFPAYMLFVVAGAYGARRYEQLLVALKKYWPALYGGYAVVAVAHIYLAYQNFLGVRSYYWAETVNILFCMLSILVFLHVSIALRNIRTPIFTKLVEHFNSVSFYIYLSHPLFIYIIQHIFYDNQIEKISTRFFISCLFVPVCTLFVSGLYARLAAIVSKRLKTV